MEWNILAAALIKRERFLLQFLREFGDFRGSGFRDVIIGAVENTDLFMNTLESLKKEHPERVGPLSQIVPIDKTFQFEVFDFMEKLKHAVAPYAEALENDSKFYVRVKRRGHKGELSSLELEKEISSFILDELEKTGKQAQIKFDDPDKIIIVETIGNRAGVGLITREMRERYTFIKIK